MGQEPSIDRRAWGDLSSGVSTLPTADVFDRLAAVMRSADVDLAIAAMDADLLLRDDFPALAAALRAGPVLGADRPAGLGTQRRMLAGGDEHAERLLREVVDLLDEQATAQQRPHLVLAGSAAVARLVETLHARPASAAWAVTRAHDLRRAGQ